MFVHYLEAHKMESQQKISSIETMITQPKEISLNNVTGENSADYSHQDQNREYQQWGDYLLQEAKYFGPQEDYSSDSRMPSSPGT